MKANKQNKLTESVRITNVQGLIESGLTKEENRTALEETASKFSIALSPHLVEQIRSGNQAIVQQYLPDPRELKTSPDEIHDPIGDETNSPVKGIVHRYPDRVLLKTVNICPVYCRFCFRRELIGPGSETLSEFELERALHYIRENEKIWEVILTGGDPLILSPARLQKLLQKISSIKHVRIVRIHTRIPIADPGRISNDLISALKSCEKSLYIALHINHPDEITSEVECAIQSLNDINCTLLSQSVLLKDINDNPDILAALFRKLVELHVKPYELHHPDKAKGTSHFRLSLTEGQKIFSALRGHISGLCLPHYMLDLPGGAGKISIAPDTINTLENGHYEVQDFKGKTHIYTDC